MRELTLTDALLAGARADGARPRLTDYDDSTGSRIELSGATLTNWAAKTANWMRDEVGIAQGDEVAVLLPAHWQTAGVLLGAWWAGAVVTEDPAAAALTLCPVNRVAEASDSPEIYVVSLHPLGAPVAALPPGTEDYSDSIRPHGDTFNPAPVGGAGQATPDLTVDGYLERVRAWDLSPGDRLLCTQGWGRAGEVLGAVLAADASLVQCTGADPAGLTRRCADERVTVTLGAAVDGIRVLISP